MKFLNIDVNFNYSSVKVLVGLLDVETFVVGKMVLGMDFRNGDLSLRCCSRLKRLSGVEKAKLFIALSAIDPKKRGVSNYFNDVTWAGFLGIAKDFCGVHNCPVCNEFIPSSKKYCSDKCRVRAHRTRGAKIIGQVEMSGVGGV